MSDVAMVKVEMNDEPVLAIRTDDRHWDDGNQSYWEGDEGDWEITDIRPLVVIDPESAADVERLLTSIRASDHSLDCEGRFCAHGTLAAALREFAAPTPPKPAEPTGHYAVIEDTRGVEWCLTGWDTDYPWQAHYQDGSGESTTYAEIDAVRVLSEGIQ